MIKGSVNSLSYLKAKKWWHRPLSWAWRQQKNAIKQQIESGVKAFDIRVAPTKPNYFFYPLDYIEAHSGLWQGACGKVRFKCNPNVAIRMINEKCKGAIVSISLEEGCKTDWNAFYDYCRLLKKSFRNITFIGGGYTPTGGRIYPFPKSEQPILWEEFV